MTKQEMIELYGEKVVDYAEGMFETDFDKDFWTDLSPEERHEYLQGAKDYLESRQGVKKPSELQEGQYITYRFPHTPNMFINFHHQYGELAAHVYCSLGEMSQDTVNLHLSRAALDEMQREIKKDGAELIPESSHGWEI